MSVKGNGLQQNDSSKDYFQTVDFTFLLFF